jgi:hypothetical protein
MSQEREKFARRLEEAADNIRDVPKHELQGPIHHSAIDPSLLPGEQARLPLASLQWLGSRAFFVPICVRLNCGDRRASMIRQYRITGRLGRSTSPPNTPQRPSLFS